MHEASNEQYRQTQLDVIREASLAAASVLQARSEANIRQEDLSFTEQNLELAVARVELGVSSAADQYRWEAQEANARSAVFAAYSNILIAEQNLNRILNRTINSAIRLQSLDTDQLMIYSSEELFELMDNLGTFERVYQFGLDYAHNASPEIKALDATIKAKKREVKALSRRSWLPEFTLNAEVSDNLDQVIGGHDIEGGEDWQVVLNAQLPFYQGGQIRAKKNRARLELSQLQKSDGHY